MGLWLTEREFRQGGAESTGVTLNVAFLRDIKQDTPSLQTQSSVIQLSLDGGSISPRQTVDLLTQYRDDLETYFALEEFYGYFSNAAETNPTISSQAAKLRTEHVELFLNLNQVIELAESCFLEKPELVPALSRALKRCASPKNRDEMAERLKQISALRTAEARRLACETIGSAPEDLTAADAEALRTILSSCSETKGQLDH